MCVWCVRAYNFVTTLRFAVNQPVTAYRHRACTPGTHVVSQQSGLKGQLHHVCQLHTQQGISTNSYTYLPPPLHTHTHTQTHTHTHTHEHTYTFAQEYSLARGRTLAQPILLSPLSWHMSNSWSTTHTCPTCGAPHTLASNLWGTTHTRLQLVGHHIYKHERAYTHRKIQIHTCRPGSRMLPAATCRWCCFSSRCVIYCSSGLTQSEGDLLGLWACSSLACGRKGTYTHNAACVFLYVPACTRASLPGG